MATPTFFRPREGSHHGAILMAWPGPKNPNYGEDEVSKLKSELAAIAMAISDYEPVTLLVHSSDLSEAETTFQSCGTYGVKIQSTDMNDLEFWMRDVAPTFVFAEGPSHLGLHGIDFNFNGWGGRYPSASNARFAKQFLADSSIPRVDTPIVLEGGALETDGEGTLLVTESSILNPNRNANFYRETIEKELCRLLGISKVIWFSGLKGYEVTDAHIDVWVRFVAPGKVVLNDPGLNRHMLTAVHDTIKQVLSLSTDAKGRQFEIIDLPGAGRDHLAPVNPDLCLNYVNFLLVNDAVIIPQFGDHLADDKARDIFQVLFPERKVIQVYLGEIVRNAGGIHCVTQDIPGKER